MIGMVAPAVDDRPIMRGEKSGISRWPTVPFLSPLAIFAMLWLAGSAVLRRGEQRLLQCVDREGRGVHAVTGAAAAAKARHRLREL